MENFSLGVTASTYGLGSLVHTLLQLQILWGFILGFLFAALVFGFIATDRAPKSVRSSAGVTPVQKGPIWVVYIATLARAGGVLALLLFLIFVVVSTIRF